MLLSGELIEVTTSTLVLLGISGAVTVGSKLHDSTQTARIESDASPVTRKPRWSDLIVNEVNGRREIDITRVQMLYFTLVTAAFVVMRVVATYVIPEIPQGFQVLMGISNAVYFGSKVAQSTASAATAPDAANAGPCSASSANLIVSPSDCSARNETGQSSTSTRKSAIREAAMRFFFAIVLALLAGANAVRAEDRFAILQPDQMNAEQKKLFEAIIAGPRSQNYGNEAVQRVLRGGPFNAWLRSPELGDRLQKVGEYVRFKTSIPQRLNELAILVTAREWTSQYEWHAHHLLAMKAGLDPKIAEDIATGKRPANMKEDEAAVYDFCVQLHRSKKVDDANFRRVKALFGEQGVIDLVGVSGYYTAVSMTLNVAEVPVPDGKPLPLKPLD